MNREDTIMKKTIAAVILPAALVMGLTGCGSKAVIEVSVDGIGEYTISKVPIDDVVNFSHNEGEMKITVKEDGDYDFAVVDENGKEYTFTVQYDGKTAEVQTEDDISVNVNIE